MSNFSFLNHEWPQIHGSAAKAESLVISDARTACFYARRTLELVVQWAYKHDERLELPYQDHLSALIHEPTFRQAVGSAVFSKTQVIKRLGNQAVHSTRPIRQYDALTAVKELFHVCFWLARTYSRETKPSDDLAFDPSLVPKESPGSKKTLEQLQQLEKDLAERDEKLSELLTNKVALTEEVKRLQAEVAQARAANTAVVDTHDYSEEETRDYFIDLLLKEAGWALDKPRDREFEVSGMPNNKGTGYVDYVLWGDDGLPLAIVEAKRTKREPRAGKQQAKLYADCLEKQFGRRPVIFYSNGYEHWLWDDLNYPPRSVQGFLKKDELELMIQRRETRRPLSQTTIDENIAGRYYQTRAIRRIGESFEKDNLRKALVVMATGAGKTRTVIALCDVLMRSNWVKRVLFLADRVALVQQAVGAFKQHLPGASPVNLVTEKDKEGRVYVSTYPTMMGLIDESKGDQRKFGVGHFDLVIIDEAHRSVYQKYRAIFEYFDSYLVGLTATPKDEVDRNTYSLFELETGVPTDVYGLDEAVADEFLVPPKAVSVPLKFQREGIRYDDLSEEEKDAWDALEWSDDGEIPDRVEAEAVNKWLFNKDTVDKVLEHVMTRGQKVAGGDRLGKTIIFAKNNAHAEFICEGFDENYPHLKGTFARVVTYKTEYAQSLIDEFSKPDSPPHIAISVDMLDTGIDIPEVVNLVFFKLVRSKTKFWQMLGRGTRLRPDLFGPGQDKEFFYVFDYCQNLEYFAQNPETTEGRLAPSLGERLFTHRLELIAELDRRLEVDKERAHEPRNEKERILREETAAYLHKQVAAMNVDNFIVRPHRRLVERYSDAQKWENLSDEDLGELSEKVAGLPTEVVDDDVDAKQFDYLMLRLQLSLLRAEPRFVTLRDQVKNIAGLLEEKSNIPMVRERIVLIQELQTDEYWEDVTAPMLEIARRRLRSLVRLIEKTERKPVFTDFEDEMGDEIGVELPGFGPSDDFERFRAKARVFLREHETHIAIAKIRNNQPLTEVDLQEIERMLVEAGIGTHADWERVKKESEGLVPFIRSLVGMDREAAKKALGQFLSGQTQTAAQIEFINLIVDHLTANGSMDPALLYESPFTDINPHGPDGVFQPAQVTELVSVLRKFGKGEAA